MIVEELFEFAHEGYVKIHENPSKCVGKHNPEFNLNLENIFASRLIWNFDLILVNWVFMGKLVNLLRDYEVMFKLHI